MFDVIIIGGGPIGLNAAIGFGKQNKSVLLLEATDSLGGQLTKLYPEKDIVDIDAIESIKAKDYIKELVETLAPMKNVTIKLMETVKSIEHNEVKTNNNSYLTKYIIICSGLGSPIPRKMGLENEDNCQNILYSLQNIEFLKDKRVLVLGGGDSALDWTKEISKISNNVNIIHRRNEFRGDFNTIKDIKNVIIKTPYIPFKINMIENKLISLVIKNVETNIEETLDADYVFVNYGNIPSINTFSLESKNNGLVVDENFMTSTENIFAIGDICRYENKKNRIQPGLNELNSVIQFINKKESL